MKSPNNIKKSKFFIFLLFFLGCIFSLAVLSTNYKTGEGRKSFVWQKNYHLYHSEYNGNFRPVLSFDKNLKNTIQDNELIKVDVYDSVNDKILASSNLKRVDYEKSHETHEGFIIFNGRKNIVTREFVE